MDNQDPKKVNQERSATLARLEEKLYSRSEEQHFDEPEHLHDFSNSVARSWNDEEEEEVAGPKTNPGTFVVPDKPKPKKKRKFPIMSTIVIASFLFMVGAAGYFLLRVGGIPVSSGNVDIRLRGPIIVDGGDELALQVTVTNHNATPLELVDLIV